MILTTEETRHERWRLESDSDDLSSEPGYDTFAHALSSAEPGDSIIHEIHTVYVTVVRDEAHRVPDASEES